MVVAQIGLADGLHLVHTEIVVDSHLSHHLALSRTQLGLCQGMLGHTHQFFDDELASTFLSVEIHSGIDVEQARVGKRNKLRFYAITEPISFSDGYVES